MNWIRGGVCCLLLLVVMSINCAWAINYSGTYTVGPGRDFRSPQVAIDSLSSSGNAMTGPVTLNVYTAVYDSGIIIVSAIGGISAANPLVIQAAPGESPVIENHRPLGNNRNLSGVTMGYGWAAKYITVRGLEIRHIKRWGFYIIGPSSATPCSSLVFENNWVHNSGEESGPTTQVFSAQYAANITLRGNRLEASGPNNNRPLKMTYVDGALIVNNIFTSPGTGQTSGATYYMAETGTQVTNDQWYFNSFCGQSVGAVIHLSGGTGCILKNNIFQSAGDALFDGRRIVAYFDAVTSVTSDHNIFYAEADTSSEVLVGANYYSLRAFKVAYPALDQHSWAFDPNYVSPDPPYNLHLGGPSIADSAGTPIAGITTDIDGNARNATNPDIGADEANVAYSDILLGYRPLKPAAGSYPTTVFLMEVDYLSRSNTAPVSPTVFLHGGSNPSYALTNPGGNYTHGVRLRTTQTPPPFGYTHNFMVSSVSLPASGNFSGPTVGYQMSGTYDIGGGDNDFSSPQVALSIMASPATAMVGPCTLNVYTGTYAGRLFIPNTIVGLGAVNPLVIQNAPGQSPVLENSTGYGILINLADYVTVRGFEVRNYVLGGIWVCGTWNDSCRNIVLDRNYVHHASQTESHPGLLMDYARRATISGNRFEASGQETAMTINFSDSLLAVNNVASSPTWGSSAYVVYVYGSYYDEWYYNTIAGYNALCSFTKLEAAIGTVFYNNIFYNGGDGSFSISGKSAWALADTTGLKYSDYNIFFAGGVDSGEVAWPYWNPRSLMWWQGEQGGRFDQHSYCFSPQFTSAMAPFDLHLLNAPSIADSAGTPLPAITAVDFDQQARDATYPDIGADEATLPYSAFLLGDRRQVVPDTGRMVDVYSYWVDYLHRGGLAPDSAWLYVDGERYAPLVLDTLRGSDYSRGVTLMADQVLMGLGAHTYHFRVWSGGIEGRWPAGSDYAGPWVFAGMWGSYDIGGGAMNFTSLVQAASQLQDVGMIGPVTLNVYTGTYAGRVLLTDQIEGLGIFPLVIQNAPGQTPVMTNHGGTVLDLWGTDSVTISGLEFSDCDVAICLAARLEIPDPPIYQYPEFNLIKGNRVSASQYGFHLLWTRYSRIEGNVVTGATMGVRVISCDSLLVCNNMIYGCHPWGAYELDGQGNRWEFNSIYYSGSSGGCYYVSLHGAYVFRNNTLYTSGGSSTACYVWREGTPLPGTSDYNNLYAPNGKVFITLDPDGIPTDQTAVSLADWQLLTGLDEHSVSGDPGFVSSTDLHIEVHSGLLESAGINSPYVWTDIDGDGRRETPDIGADEYEYVAPPQRVTDLTVISEGSGIRLRWSASLGTGIVSYQVYALSDIGGTATLLTTTTDTTYSLPNTSTREFFYVIASDQAQ